MTLENVNILKRNVYFLYDNILKIQIYFQQKNKLIIILYGSTFSINVQRSLKRKLKIYDCSLFLIKNKFLISFFKDIISVDKLFQGNLYVLEIPLTLSSSIILDILEDLEQTLNLKILLGLIKNKIYYLNTLKEFLNLNNWIYLEFFNIIQKLISNLSYCYLFPIHIFNQKK